MCIRDRYSTTVKPHFERFQFVIMIMKVKLIIGLICEQNLFKMNTGTVTLEILRSNCAKLWGFSEIRKRDVDTLSKTKIYGAGNKMIFSRRRKHLIKAMIL